MMHVEAHYRLGECIGITTDASPWGLGAFVSINGQPTEYFAVATKLEDAANLGIEFTQDSKVQQAFEALALLVALRMW